MAISISTRPRQLSYTNDASPAVQVYSNWNTSENTGSCNYGFAIVNTADVNSTIEIKIYESGSDTLLSSSIHRPFKIGTFNIDLASYVRAYLYSSYQKATARNVKHVGTSIRFYITYRQILSDGTEQDLYSEIQRPLYMVCSAKQVGDVNGVNMEEYIMFPDELNEDERGKFLTKFENPPIWSGYERTVSFIYDNYLIGNELNAVQIDRDINLNQVSNNTEVLDASQVYGVNLLKVNYPATGAYTDLYLSLGDQTANYYVDQGYVDDGYTEIV